MFYNVTCEPSGWVMQFDSPDAHEEDEGFKMIGSTSHQNKFGVNIKVNVMQFIGLYDKNNAEIYEGDIILYFDAVYEVIWDKEYVGFLLVRGVTIGKFYDYKREELKVIGNIYENPGLREKIK